MRSGICQTIKDNISNGHVALPFEMFTAHVSARLQNGKTSKFYEELWAPINTGMAAPKLNNVITDTEQLKLIEKVLNCCTRPINIAVIEAKVCYITDQIDIYFDAHVGDLDMKGLLNL